MGEAQRRSRNRKEIINSAKRCVYCDCTENAQIEHMPPRAMFNGDRPSGWEFACCERCNQGTRGADAVAVLVAMLEIITTDDWKLEKGVKLKGRIDTHAPNVWEEIFGTSLWQDARINHGGVWRSVKATRLNGFYTKKYLDVFSAKVAMASFSNFVARPLNMNGLIYTEWFANAGLNDEEYNRMVSIMPNFTQLTQGKKVSGKKFSVRSNTDAKSIVVGLASFHNSLSVLFVATDNSQFISALKEIYKTIPLIQRPTVNLRYPGFYEIADGN